MGGGLIDEIPIFVDLSTREANYPQIITSYPQDGCLDRQLLNTKHPIYGPSF